LANNKKTNSEYNKDNELDQKSRFLGLPNPHKEKFNDKM